jgi:hypothetical protein
MTEKTQGDFLNLTKNDFGLDVIFLFLRKIERLSVITAMFEDQSYTDLFTSTSTKHLKSKLFCLLSVEG